MAWSAHRDWSHRCMFAAGIFAARKASVMVLLAWAHSWCPRSLYSLRWGFGTRIMIQSLSSTPRIPRIMGGILVAMWNFMGWDNASTIATEVKNPQRTYPRAMLWTLVAIIASYILPVAASWYFGIPLSAWSNWNSGRQSAALSPDRSCVTLSLVGGMLSSARWHAELSS